MTRKSRWIVALAVVAGIAFAPGEAEAQVFVPAPVVQTQWAPAPVTTTTYRYGLFGRRRSSVTTQRPQVFTPAPVFVPAPVVTTSGFWTPQPVFVR